MANDSYVLRRHEPAAYVTSTLLARRTPSSSWRGTVFHPAARQHDTRFSTGHVSTERCGRAGRGRTIFNWVRAAYDERWRRIDGQTQMTWIDPSRWAGRCAGAEGLKLPMRHRDFVRILHWRSKLSDVLLDFRHSAQPRDGERVGCNRLWRVASAANYQLNAANQYTLRLRGHCPEIAERNCYYFLPWRMMVRSATAGQSILSPAKLTFGDQEFVNA